MEQEEDADTTQSSSDETYLIKVTASHVQYQTNTAASNITEELCEVGNQPSLVKPDPSLDSDSDLDADDKRMIQEGLRNMYRYDMW